MGQAEYWDGATKYVTGRSKHTSESYNDGEILVTSDHPQYLNFTWVEDREVEFLT